jgi:L-ribulose-5-phosphate 3-epimerase
MPHYPIGFMQGRLSPLVDGKIQAFPWKYWRQEYPAAAHIGISYMEWTLDEDRLYENPFMTAEGHQEIFHLGKSHGLKVKSVTGDCFMQAPFWKAFDSRLRQSLVDKLYAIVGACGCLGVETIVIPLVDNGSMDNLQQRETIHQVLHEMKPLLRNNGVRIVFEVDLPPESLLEWIETYDRNYFGINYDMGNSAALGFDPREEINSYGSWIDNVHVKDRIVGGTTIALTSGAVDFTTIFSALRKANYQGLYILQSARAEDNDHAGLLVRYVDMVTNWLQQSSRGGEE